MSTTQRPKPLTNTFCCADFFCIAKPKLQTFSALLELNCRLFLHGKNGMADFFCIAKPKLQTFNANFVCDLNRNVYSFLFVTTISFDMERGEAFTFRTPSSILFAGPSSCGKSMFTRKLLLDHSDEMFGESPEIVYYCYGAWQDSFTDMKKRGIKFHKGVPSTTQLQTWFLNGGLLVLDDFMAEGTQDKELLDLFTKHSYHQNITVMFLCQDMFPPGKYAKCISRNAHYVVAFKNPRDQLGMRNLLLQAFPSHWQDVMNVFTKVTKRPYGFGQC